MKLNWKNLTNENRVDMILGLLKITFHRSNRITELFDAKTNEKLCDLSLGKDYEEIKQETDKFGIELMPEIASAVVSEIRLRSVYDNKPVPEAILAV